MRKKIIVIIIGIVGLFIIGSFFVTINFNPTTENKLHLFKTIISISPNYKLNDKVKIKIDFHERKGNLLFPVPNANINVVVTDPKGKKYVIPVTENKEKSLDPQDLKDYKNYSKNFKRLNRYYAEFANANIKGTYTVRVVSKAPDGTSSSDTLNFIVEKSSKLVLSLDVNARQLDLQEKYLYKNINAGLNTLNSALKKVGKTAGKNTGVSDNTSEVPKGIVDIIAGVSTDTGGVATLTSPRFIGKIILPNNIIIKISSNYPDPNSEWKRINFKYIETKKNKQYFKLYFYPSMIGNYKITLSVDEGKYASDYKRSKSVTAEFSLK